MKIYVGRWDLLPDDWEGVNGLYEADQEKMLHEIAREVAEWAESHSVEDNNMGVYSPEEFEETFNADDSGEFNGLTYFIKFYYD